MSRARAVHQTTGDRRSTTGDHRPPLRRGLRRRLRLHRWRLRPRVEREGWIRLDEAGEIRVHASLPAVESAQEVEDAFGIALLYEDHDRSDDDEDDGDDVEECDYDVVRDGEDDP